MERLRLLLIKPAESDPATVDQSQGARLAALHWPTHGLVDLEEESFGRGDHRELEAKLVSWAGKISGVIGATNVAESIRVSEIAEKLRLLCFVSNNNPSVWQGRRHVFHIGLPTRQTATAVAQLLRKGGFNRVFLLHDETEFQSRVAVDMVSALEERGLQASSRSGSDAAWLDEARSWEPELLYLIYSEERRALPLAQLMRKEISDIPLLVGRSLLRSSFIGSLGPTAEGVLFVDLFRRNQQPTAQMVELTRVLSEQGVEFPTANHGFGWDAMTLCALALSKGHGNALRAIEYLESGVTMEGVTGQFHFSRENHNGREGFSPTVISRWHHGGIEEAYHD